MTSSTHFDDTPRPRDSAGRWLATSPAPLVEDTLTLPIGRLAGMAVRAPGTRGSVEWYRHRLSSIRWRAVLQHGHPAVLLSWRAGARAEREVVELGRVPRAGAGGLWLGKCPGCGSAVAALYLALRTRWRCRVCVPRRYASQYAPTSPRLRSLFRGLGSVEQPRVVVDGAPGEVYPAHREGILRATTLEEM